MFWGFMPFNMFWMPLHGNYMDFHSSFYDRAMAMNGAIPYPMMNFGFNSFISNQYNLLAACERGKQLGMTIGANSVFNVKSAMLGNNLNALNNDVTNAIKSDKLTEAQKQELQVLKQEVEALQKRLEEFQKLRRQGATYNELDTTLLTLDKDYNELRQRIKAKADEIKAILEDQTPTQNENSDGTNITQTSSTVTSSTGSTAETTTSTITQTQDSEATTTQTTQELNPNVDDFTNNNTAYQAEIVFNLTFWGYSGNCRAAFTDQRGVKHTFTANTGMSRSYYHARVDLANQIRQQIQEAGFTNVTLSNPNNFAF